MGEKIKANRWAIRCALVQLLLLTAPASAIAEDAAVFQMREVSVFEELAKEDADDFGYRYLGREVALCDNEPNEQVKAYPKLRSKNPLYGSVTFARSYVDPTVGLEFHFVLDKSGESKSPDAEKKQTRSLLQSLFGALAGAAATASDVHYDRLYFDANRDLDLTNDPVVKPMKDPPSGVSQLVGEMGDSCVFEYLNVKFDYGPGLGPQPFRMVPMLQASDPTSGYLLLTPTVAREGKSRVGTKQYTAVLTQSYTIAGRFDGPFTSLSLTRENSTGSERSWSWVGWLCGMLEVDGQLYSFSATPTGDKLTVAPYRGDFGTFEIGPGQRNIDKLGATGRFLSNKPSLVNVGEGTSPFLPGTKKSRRHRLPVGDYLPTSLEVDFGPVGVSLSPNDYSEDGTDDRKAKPPTYGIKIRKDKPYVLDFSNKPAVLFTGPGKDETLRPGSNVHIEAVLTDPVLDLMIGGLEDKTRKVTELTFKDPQGKDVTIPRYASLDPTIVIADSSGKEVSGGKMPFG
jgi:hypothetical protein